MSAAHADTSLVYEHDNIHLPDTGKFLSSVLITIGSIMVAATLGLAFKGDEDHIRAALHSYHAGMLVALGAPLGALVFVMILLQVQAGWAVSIRRQFENIMRLVWVGFILFIVGAIMQVIAVKADPENSVYIFKWMNPLETAGDSVYESKAIFLNPFWFSVRAVVYFVVWFALSGLLWKFARQHDQDKNNGHILAARKLAAVGIILFAFSTAFASFDWIMSLDYHWFSTMFGVFFFAGNILSAITLGTLILLILRARGRLHIAFTKEHMHDLGKLMFGFVIFWAYISFSQYFLIWYANIPEETAYFLKRKEGVWEIFSFLIPICGFLVPFFILLFRPNKRNPLVMGFVCVWLLVMHVLDMLWYVRAEGGDTLYLIDVLAVAGPIVFFLGFVIRQVGSGPLIPLSDPRMHEGLGHKNFV